MLKLLLKLTAPLISAFVFSACGHNTTSSLASRRALQTIITHDTGATLEEILQYDIIQSACPQYWQLLDAEDKPLASTDAEKFYELEVLCGKWMFIGWETSGKMPLPEILLDAMERSWPERVGQNFSNLGFLANPSDPSGRPLGIARSTTRYTGMPSVNVTCAACHVGKLPDGRYAIGAPNTKLHLSEFNLISYYPLFAAMHKRERDKLSGNIKVFYEELERSERRRIGNGEGGIDWSNVVFKYSTLLRWIGIGPKGLPDAQFVVMPPERDLQSWMNGRRGVFNPGAPMLTIQVENVPNLSIPQLWGISGHETEFQAGRVAPVGQTTKYSSLEKFISSAFIYAYQDLALVRPRYVNPLVSFLRQLKAPKTLESIPSAISESGRVLFTENCKSCHDGAAGESTRLYRSALVGTNPSLENPRENYVATTPIAKLVDSLSEQLKAELRPQPSGIRSRRLSGIWSRQDLMIDGSVENLDDLFCINRQRLRGGSPHGELCGSFNLDEKTSLIAFLKTL